MIIRSKASLITGLKIYVSVNVIVVFHGYFHVLIHAIHICFLKISNFVETLLQQGIKDPECYGSLSL